MFELISCRSDTSDQCCVRVPIALIDLRVCAIGHVLERIGFANKFEHRRQVREVLAQSDVMTPRDEDAVVPAVYKYLTGFGHHRLEMAGTHCEELVTVPAFWKFTADFFECQRRIVAQ